MRLIPAGGSAVRPALVHDREMTVAVGHFMTKAHVVFGDADEVNRGLAFRHSLPPSK